MNSEEIKTQLKESARQCDPDENWQAGGVDRMYFHDPDDVETSGAVDVQRGDKIDRVKVELWVTPETAAKIVAMVTRKAQPKIVPKLALGSTRPVLKKIEPIKPPQPIVSVRVHKTPIEIADEKRNAELEILVAEQEADEAEQEERERDSLA